MNTTQFSFELFPPKTDKGFVKMQATVDTLQALNPDFFSVTYGAGGSTRDRTFETVDWLVSKQIKVAPHLVCIGSSETELIEILTHYKDQGVNQIVALRGDIPSGSGLVEEEGILNHANELVSLIQRHFKTNFHIEIAAYPEYHPQALSAEQDLQFFENKVKAGADSAITQYFYNPDAYFYFVENCQKRQIDIPIVPGIMPITNFTQLARFSDSCGAEIPRWLRKKLESYGDDLDSIRQYGEEVVTKMCEKLLAGGAPGLHFYTMNQAPAVVNIWHNLAVKV